MKNDSISSNTSVGSSSRSGIFDNSASDEGAEFKGGMGTDGNECGGAATLICTLMATDGSGLRTTRIP